MCLLAQICISHFSRHTFQGLPRDDDWMCSQLASTMNWRCPAWMDWFHGGLQFQVEHHLFPRVPRHNLRKVQAMLEPVCVELGLDYYCPGFRMAVWDTFVGLKKVADEARNLANPKMSKTSRTVGLMAVIDS
ncbi:unnamed protein product [Ostreobium quekettii]|uniref:Fatty acid desaturase domain-containing protein n=1 Tax=Ostreobium quekettii TaxID=121088 RepID=A0A8S1IXA0_9CHLO|nr:unnamed protein product [Ostreobium quekettii]